MNASFFGSLLSDMVNKQTHVHPAVCNKQLLWFVVTELSRGRSVKQRLANYSTAMESIQAESEPVELDNEDVP